MDAIAQVFVGNPGLLLLIGVLFFGAYLLVRSRGSERLRSRALLIPAIAWTV